ELVQVAVAPLDPAAPVRVGPVLAIGNLETGVGLEGRPRPGRRVAPLGGPRKVDRHVGPDAVGPGRGDALHAGEIVLAPGAVTAQPHALVARLDPEDDAAEEVVRLALDR